MTIEEKAKAYDVALEVAKRNYETIVQMDENCTFAKEGIVNTFHHMFPELKENEDEQHRKWILEYLYDGLQKSDEQFKDQFKSAIAWLEKQGEQKQIRQQCADFYNKDSELQMPRLTAFENELANILFDREYDGSTETEDDIQRGKLEYELAAIRLAPKLQSLINIEQKPAEWTKEDEKYWSIVIAEFSKCAGKSVSKDEWIRCNDFLHSLRDRVFPQNTWKPSDEQIEAIRLARSFITDDFDDTPTLSEILIGLEEQLKKLKKE